jgi:hypothetical protein
MDIALTTPVAEGRQGANSEKRPAAPLWSDSEERCWELSEASLGYQALEDSQYGSFPGRPPGQVPGGPGG